MKPWTEVVTEDRRLAILRVLKDQDGYSLNESVLDSALEQLGHRVSRDRVRGDMNWLAEQELVRLENPGGILLVAILTQRGQDVATGAATHPGVKRPSPR